MEKIIYNMLIDFDDMGDYHEHLIENVIEHHFNKAMGELIVKIVYINNEGSVCTSDESYSLGVVKSKTPKFILKDNKISPVQLDDLERLKWEFTGKRVRFFTGTKNYGGRQWQRKI